MSRTATELEPCQQHPTRHRHKYYSRSISYDAVAFPLLAPACMPETSPSRPEPVQRISISLPVPLYKQFGEMMDERGFSNRSQAISEMMQQQISDYYSLKGDHLMAGTITLLYDHKKPGLKQQLSEIQYTHITEVISSLQVLLENSHTMEVLLVQGRAKTLRRIASELLACKGVLSGRFNLSRTILPPIQSPAMEAEAV